MASSYVEWCCLELSKLLQIPSTDEVISYIANIQNEDDLEEYLSSVLDLSNPRHSSFKKEALLRHQNRNSFVKDNDRGDGVPSMTLYKKPELPENYVSTNKEVGKKSKRTSKKTNQGQNVQDKTQLSLDPSLPVIGENVRGKPGVGKKSKYVPLFTDEGKAKDVIHIPGRHPCHCEASKHKLVANCLNCGRIVCSQEGSGPCFTCNNLVCTREEREYIATGSKKSVQLYEKLMAANTVQVSKELDDNMNDFASAQLQKAVEHKNRLLEYDRTSAKRTQVIDDDSDYFATDKWLPATQREKMKAKAQELHSKRHASRLSLKVSFDFAGRQVVEENDEIDYQSEMNDVLNDNDIHLSSFTSQGVDFDEEHFPSVDPTITVQHPEYDSSDNSIAMYSAKNKKISEMNWARSLKIQDRGLQEMSDMGMCLSMHQPWASLLVLGIKKHEGRTWYTAHRGCLWIQAGSKVPSRQEITEIERIYEAMNRNNVELKFPDHYPTGCLLGCVNLVDCLPQEEYRIQFPDGESESPYVFICEDPQELIIKFPIKGQHKIFKLDSKIHQAATKTLRK